MSPRFDHFSLVAPFYDRLFALDPGPLRELLELPGDGRILDIGGGTGRVAQALRDSDEEIIVLDESVGMLRQARCKGLMAVCGEAERIPFAHGTFSRVLMVDTFHHLRNQRQAATEVLRVLVRGGRLVMEEPNLERIAVRLIALGEKLALMRSHFRSPQVVQEMFEAAGGRVRLKREGARFWVVVEARDDRGSDGIEPLTRLRGESDEQAIGQGGPETGAGQASPQPPSLGFFGRGGPY
ncbi:MAG: class I SAM-dependent methyltransferase [Anaerolineae bacterium]